MHRGSGYGENVRYLITHTSWSGGHYYAANALNKLKRFDEATIEINTALKISPEDLKALNLKGRILNKLGKQDDAMKVYDQILAIDPDNFVKSPSCLMRGLLSPRSKDEES